MTVVYFSWVREQVGHGQENFPLPDGVASLGDLLDWLTEKSPGHKQALAERAALRFAVNLDYATLSDPISEDDEVAIFPPVTGG